MIHALRVIALKEVKFKSSSIHLLEKLLWQRSDRVRD
jgi:hypothetical protein